MFQLFRQLWWHRHVSVHLPGFQALPFHHMLILTRKVRTRCCRSLMKACNVWMLTWVKIKKLYWSNKQWNHEPNHFDFEVIVIDFIIRICTTFTLSLVYFKSVSHSVVVYSTFYPLWSKCSRLKHDLKVYISESVSIQDFILIHCVNSLYFNTLRYYGNKLFSHTKMGSWWILMSLHVT